MINIIEAKQIKDFKLQLLFEISDYKVGKKEQVRKEADLKEYLMAKKRREFLLP
ncbi:MAG: hypothetical protein PHO62_06590 [Sulfurimonas sp.]|uniref:hypothetical protein n=1 Tax=Sulfurimonas sp. TaxID=2022749 RepID=UPI002624639D|nr:hypothetical protein [Sulfurimonas sp.]MDD5373077.1 hypothetical protein [Sulfurimonas sp.]